MLIVTEMALLNAVVCSFEHVCNSRNSRGWQGKRYSLCRMLLRILLNAVVCSFEHVTHGAGRERDVGCTECC